MAKLGRKPLENPKIYLYKFRMDYPTMMRLENCCKKLGMKRSEFLRYLIDKTSDELYRASWETGVSVTPIEDPEITAKWENYYRTKIEEKPAFKSSAQNLRDKWNKIKNNSRHKQTF